MSLTEDRKKRLASRLFDNQMARAESVSSAEGNGFNPNTSVAVRNSLVRQDSKCKLAAARVQTGVLSN